MTTIFYDKPWCQVSWLATTEAVCLTWKGFANSEQFREACNASLELLEKKQATKMLADNREAKAISDADQKWMNESWFSRAYEKGYRGSAVLVGNDLFRELAVKKIVNDMEEGKFVVQFFQDEETALQWLQEF